MKVMEYWLNNSTLAYAHWTRSDFTKIQLMAKLEMNWLLDEYILVDD